MFNVILLLFFNSSFLRSAEVRSDAIKMDVRLAAIIINYGGQIVKCIPIGIIPDISALGSLLHAA